MEIITHKPEKKEGLLSRFLSATPDQARDTGMALTLLCLLIVQFKQAYRLVPVAIILLIITMAWPRAFKPLAGFWFGLSHVLGNVMSKVVLTIVFFLVVTPIGVIRRLLGKDSLQLKKFKKDQDSVFMVRAELVEKEHLHKPY
jgi:hypothetical protein